jgi:hypothetical protein
MIKKFHVLYVGQIELDNIGLNGTPANDRRYSDQRLREAFNTAREVAQLMDELGFDVLWTAEHHFQRESYEVFPNLIQERPRRYRNGHRRCDRGDGSGRNHRHRIRGDGGT